MKNIKSLIFLLFTLSFIKAYSQFESISYSDVVISGKCITKEIKWKSDRSHIITLSTIKVADVFKGELQDSIIEIE